MKKISNIEDEYAAALKLYLETRITHELAADTLNDLRIKMKDSRVLLSDKSLEKIAEIFADLYSCRWHRTNQNNISFADSLSDVTNTRRDDVLNAFRKHVINWKKLIISK